MKTKRINHVEEYYDEDSGKDYLFDLNITVEQSTPSEMCGVPSIGSDRPRIYITAVDYDVEQIISYAPPQYVKIKKTELTDDMVDKIVDSIDLMEAL